MFKNLLKYGKIGAAIIALIAALTGVYFAGHKSAQDDANAKIAAYQTEVVALDKKYQAARTAVNVKIETQYVDRVNTITRTVTKNHDIILSSVPVGDFLSNGWVYSYNASIAGTPIDPAQASISVLSGITDRAALDVINDNNGVALRNAEKLSELQEWVREQEAVNPK